jgi:hypothetical protein
MTDIVVAQRMWQRRGTAALWASTNPIMADGEIGFETNVNPHKMKVGDGATAWNSLPYFTAGAALSASASIGCTFDGAGAPLALGSYCDVLVPWNCTINEATLLADTAGSLVVSVWADIYGNYPPTVADNIAGSALPTLASAFKSQDAGLSGWTTSLAAGSTVRFGVQSCSGITRATLTLSVTKT